MKQLKQLLMVMAIALTGFTPAQAQTTPFNHYSEWMAYARRNMVYNGSGYTSSDSGADWWRYDDGLMYESILDTYEYYKTRGGVHGSDLLSGVERYLNKSITGTVNNLTGTVEDLKITNFTGKNGEKELDDMRPGRLVYKYCYTYDHSENSKIAVYKAACKAVIDAPAFQDDFRVGYSDGHKDFPWQHKASYTQQVWLDGIFMGIPFWTLAGPHLGSSQKSSWGTNATKFFDDAVRQMQVTDSTTFVPSTRLWCHAWDYTKKLRWADCISLSLHYPHITAETTSGNNTGRSLHTWGRALGWYAMAIMETMDNITAVDANYAKLNDMKALFKKVMDAVISYRDETSGVWYCVLDVGDNTAADSPYNQNNYPVDEKPEKNNYLEATCSSMFAYCLLRGVAQGYLPPSYLDDAKSAYTSVVRKFITHDSNNNLYLNSCMKVGGLDATGKGNRDGSFAYYMHEDSIQNDSKGVGPFIWASLEAEKIGYNMETNSFGPIDENTIVTFAWSKASDEITQGASYTSPTFTAKTYGNDTPLTNSDVIAFESSAPSVATVAADGTVTPVGIGTATITAALKTVSTYTWSGPNPTYTITVNAPDVTAPTLKNQSIENNATNVSTSGTIVLTFSEDVACTTNATLTPAGGSAINLTPSVSGSTVTYSYSGLSNETSYTFNLADNSVTDLAGNKYASAVSFSFTTGAAPVNNTYSFGFNQDILDSYDSNGTLLSNPSHDGTVIDISSTFSNGDAYVTSSSTKENCVSISSDASENYNQNYIEIQSTEAIKSIYLVAAVTGSTDASSAVAVGWTSTPSATISEYHTFTTPGKGSTSGHEITINFPTSGIKYVRLYRKIKLDSATKTTFQSNSSTTIPSSASTYGIAFIKVTTESSSTPPTPTTYSVTYNGNGNTSGTAPTDNTSYSSGATVTVLGNTGNLVKTGYTFNGWNTAADGNGTARAVSSTFPISANTELFAKWTANSYTVTLNANTANHGTGENGSATATYNGTALSSITHTTAASGYARKGYYTTATEGTKVLNADGSFASANITDYITDSKWTRIGETTLYAQYEEESTLTTIPKGTTVTFTGTETLSNGMLLFNNRVQVETLTSGGSLNSSTKLENGVLSLGTNHDYLHIKVPANSKVIVNAKAGSTADNKGMYIGTSNNSTTKNYSPTTDYENYEYVSNAGGDIYIRRVSTTISIKIITVEDNSNAPSAPTFSPVSGTTVSGSQSITMSGPEGSTIYYKWDTSAPTASDLITNNQTGTSTTVESGKTLYAVAKVGEDVSSVASASYTVDSTAPTLSSSTPANDATNVAQSTSSIVLTESETVTAVGENIAGTIKVGDAEATAITFTLTNGNTLTYNLPTLSYSTTYVVKLSANQVQDGVGNQNAEQTVTFTTEAAPPATYSITATSNNNTWGTVSVDPTTAAEGATVTITTTPASGYRLTNLTATDASEGNVTITNNQFTMPASAVTVNATFAAMEKVATPTITCSPASPFTTSTDVTISCGTAGSSIYYTTNGSAPTTSSTLYSAPFSISATTTVKAIAVKADMTDSDVATQTFTKSGGGSSTVLFSQDFNDATAVAYATSTARAYNKTNTLGNCVGSGKDLFTSITSVSQSASGVAINSSTGGNNRNATGIFQVIKKGNSAYWSICRTEDFATTAPTAIKVAMDFWFENTNSGTVPGVNFAIGDDFTDGLNGSSPQNASNVHSGFCIIDNSSPTLAQYNSTTAIYNTAITEQTWLSITWVINNTGEALTYDNPTGSGTTTLDNDCYDIWLKTKAGANSTYTKVVTNQAATTASKDLQNIYIGNNVSSGKQHEFMLDNFVVTDLTPSSAPTETITIAEAGFSTLYKTYAVEVDNEHIAYYVSDVRNKQVVFTPFDNNIIPANTGAVIKGTFGDEVTLTTTTADTFSGTNYLLGTDTKQNITADKTNYYYFISGRQKQPDNSYKYGWLVPNALKTTSVFSNNANKAYLQIPKSMLDSETAARMLTLVWEDYEQPIATGIDGFATDKGFIVIDDNTPLYNLSGQRVSKSYKGIVIINGKKVLRK